MFTVAALFKDILEIVKNRADALDVLSFVLDIKYESLPLHMSDLVNPDKSHKISIVLEQLKKGVPVAYVTNRRHFFGREFYVNEDVLIPRHETEILVEKALEHVPVKNPRILDLCTGSGCILLSLLSELQGAVGVGVDNSEAALKVANINKHRLGLDERASFVCADVLGELNFQEKFDMVLCNPPYIAEQEYEKLEKSVLYEPVSALIAKDEGLAFYKKLIDIVPDLCNKNWVALFEIGTGQFNALHKVYSSFDHRFYCDLSGIKRVLFWKSLL